MDVMSESTILDFWIINKIIILRKCSQNCKFWIWFWEHLSLSKQKSTLFFLFFLQFLRYNRFPHDYCNNQYIIEKSQIDNNSLSHTKWDCEYHIDFKYHYLRHTYGTTLATLNTPEHLLCSQMGHSSSAVTHKYYIAISEQGVEELLKNLEMVWLITINIVLNCKRRIDMKELYLIMEDLLATEDNM